MKLTDFIDWLLIIVIALMVWSLSACGGGDPPKPRRYEASTPNGIRLSSAQPIASDLLPEIDKQYQDLLDIASRQYDVYPAHSQIFVEIVPISPLCESGISFLITRSVTRGTNYDGTEYDKDGETNGKVMFCAAGQFIEPNTIKVTPEGIRTSPVVRFELEHLILYHFDRLRYLQTAYHDTQGGHPIL